MTVENPELVTVLVAVMALLVLVQSAFIVVAILQVKKRLEKLSVQAERFTRSLNQFLEAAEQGLDKADIIRQELPGWEETISRSADTLQRTARQFDAHASRTLSFMREQVEMLKDHSDELIAKFSQTSYKVHRAVLNPARHFSAAVAALQAGLTRLFSRNDKGLSDRSYPDQQIFI